VGGAAAGLTGEFDVPFAVGEFVEKHGECSRYEAGGEIVQPNLRSHSCLRTAVRRGQTGKIAERLANVREGMST
jgi:hypothetical protein